MSQDMTLEEKNLFDESRSQKFILGQKHVNIKHEIDSIEHELKLINLYKKYHQSYKEYTEILNGKIFGRKNMRELMLNG